LIVATAAFLSIFAGVTAFVFSGAWSPFTLPLSFWPAALGAIFLVLLAFPRRTKTVAWLWLWVAGLLFLAGIQPGLGEFLLHELARPKVGATEHLLFAFFIMGTSFWVDGGLLGPPRLRFVALVGLFLLASLFLRALLPLLFLVGIWRVRVFAAADQKRPALPNKWLGIALSLLVILTLFLSAKSLHPLTASDEPPTPRALALAALEDGNRLRALYLASAWERDAKEDKPQAQRFLAQVFQSLGDEEQAAVWQRRAQDSQARLPDGAAP
jgi:hypothetical protein